MEGRVRKVEPGDDEGDAENAEEGEAQAAAVAGLAKKQWFQKDGEDREARVSQKPHGHRGDLDRLEEQGPVDGQDEAAEGEQAGIPS